MKRNTQDENPCWCESLLYFCVQQRSYEYYTIKSIIQNIGLMAFISINVKLKSGYGRNCFFLFSRTKITCEAESLYSKQECSRVAFQPEVLKHSL